METVVLVLLILVLLLMAAMFLRMRAPQQQENPQATLLIQQQIDASPWRSEPQPEEYFRFSGSSMRIDPGSLYQSLKLTSETMNQQLNVVTAQLSNVTSQLQNNTGQVGSRLDTAAKVIQDVQTSLGN